MKSIFRTMAVMAVLLCVLSCSLESLYVQVPDTSWNIEIGDNRAFVHFSQTRASLLQRDKSSGSVTVKNGDYSAKGHAINIALDHGGTQKITRTFSHLKNATSKNYSSFWPESCALDNTVWHTIYKDSLRILYFRDGTVHRFSFADNIEKESFPYSVSGNQVSLGQETATLYPEVMLVKDHWYMHFVQPQDGGSGEMAGSMWTLQSASYPGCILFDSGSTFTHIVVTDRVFYEVTQGTYSRNGDKLTLTEGDTTEECPISGDSFAFQGKTYENLK